MEIVYAYCFYVLLTLFMHVRARNEEYIPVVIWSSPQFQDGPILALNKIRSDLFETFMDEKLTDKKPLIVLFLEQNLCVQDFDWRARGVTPFPYLSELPHKVNFFPSVANPHQVISKLIQKGYKWSHMHPDVKISQNESLLLLVEFRKIVGDRPTALRNHEGGISQVCRDVEKMRADWVCIYTARHTLNSISRRLSPWHVTPETLNASKKIISIYRDHKTGVVILTRGPIQLHLPTERAFQVKELEDHHKMSATKVGETMHILLWFQNYTLTLYVSQLSAVWAIDTILIENADGETMILMPTSVMEPFRLNKCYPRIIEFQSLEKPFIRVKVNKYLIARVTDEDGLCVSPYSVPFLGLIMLCCIISVGIMWYMFVPAHKKWKHWRHKTLHLSLEGLRQEANWPNCTTEIE